ncbi:MAG: helix-turn-helix domain-containing protein [Lachnospiraceae bacterium]|nr:helix-turn-helix domain-containing protein [Lachnospiraceae bacterium]
MNTKDRQTLQEKSHLPEKLRALREEYGLSRKELAEKLTNDSISISASTIASYENGKTWPNLDRCIRLCEVLDVSLNYLLMDGEREKFGEGYLIDDAARMDMLEQVKDHFGPTGDLDRIKDSLKLNEEQLDELLLNVIDMAVSGEELSEDMFL